LLPLAFGAVLLLSFLLWWSESISLLGLGFDLLRQLVESVLVRGDDLVGLLDRHELEELLNSLRGDLGGEFLLKVLLGGLDGSSELLVRLGGQNLLELSFKVVGDAELVGFLVLNSDEVVGRAE